VDQPAGTVFKISPEAWNNVPIIVYEAVARIVSAVDAGAAEQRRRSDEVSRQFRDMRSLVGAVENAAKSENDKLGEENTQEKKIVDERFSKAEADMLELRERLNRQRDEAQVEIEKNASKDEEFDREMLEL